MARSMFRLPRLPPAPQPFACRASRNGSPTTRTAATIGRRHLRRRCVRGRADPRRDRRDRRAASKGKRDREDDYRYRDSYPDDRPAYREQSTIPMAGSTNAVNLSSTRSNAAMSASRPSTTPRAPGAAGKNFGPARGRRELQLLDRQ